MISINFLRSELCQICGRKSQGIHFGVSSCRACAAFFRRCAGSEVLLSKGCLSSRCGKEYFLCKPCRLQKCHNVGMDVAKFQFDRDAISSTDKMPKSFDVFIGRPQFVHFCDTSSESTSSGSFIDLTWLIDKADKIFKRGPNFTPHVKRGPLRKLADFHDVIEKMPKIMAVGGEAVILIKLIFKLFRQTIRFPLVTARTVGSTTSSPPPRSPPLTNFDEFHLLDHDLKMKLLFAIWHMWSRMDKLAATALARKRNLLSTESMIAQSNGLFLDVDTLALDVSWISRYTLEECEFFIDGFRGWDLMETVPMFMELEPSEIEINYMLAQMSFHYAGKRFGGKILEICDKFQEIIAEDLHNYYVEERKLPNYSGRLAKLMKINNAVQKSVWNRRPKTEIAKTLHIFTAEFSHPEMFFDTGFT